MFIYNFKINGTKTFKLIGSIISIIVISIFIFSFYKIVYMAKSEGFSNSNSSEASEISPENYSNILKNVHENIDKFVGKKISFTGYIYRVYDFDENQFVLARDMIISPDNQTVVIGFLCESKEAKSLVDGTWVHISGEITKGNYHGEIPVIKIDKIEETPNCDKQKVNPPDDSYIQTSSEL